MINVLHKTSVVKFVLISILLITCNTSEPETIDYHNKILFTSNRSGKNQLYMMNPDGTNIRQITSGEYSHGYGRWSPDASKIVCGTEEGSTTAGGTMVVMNSDGSNRKLIGWGNQMCWAPDGKKIALVYLPMAELGFRFRFIYVINADGTGRKQITRDSLEIIYSPCWAPDGSKIYFVSNRYNITQPNASELYNMNTDGIGITRLTFTDNGSTYSPSISSTGNKIVFISTRNGAEKGSIYTCDINGNNIILIRTPPENEIYNFPRWSPDEQSIIFIGASADGTEKTSIYKIGANGKDLTKLIDNASNPDWSK